MSRMEGVCSKCGARYCGWPLRTTIPQSCGKCGGDLEIKRNDVLIASCVSTINTVVVDELTSPSFFKHRRKPDKELILILINN
jgi:hypothetical protein